MRIRGAESLPEVRDAGPVAVRRDLNDPASAAMAAAAGYSSKAGQYVAQGARDLAAGIEKMARDRAEAGALAAYNDYVSRSSHLLYDPNTGLMHAKGAGAEGLSGRAHQAHKVLKDEIMSALPAGQRRLFAERTASYDRGVGSACMKLEGEQMSLYKQEEAERTLKTIYTAAALNPEGFSMEAQEDAFREITIARYGDQGPEANLKNSGLVRSEFFIGMIQQAAQNDPTRAETLVKEYGGYIEPADAQKLKGAVEKAALPAKAQAEAQRLLEKYGADGLASALADVRDAHEGKEEDVYLGYVNSLFADAKQEQTALYRQTRGELAKLYLKSGGLNGVDLQALVDAGRLDAEGALMWSERISADRERRAAAADRSANAAYRAMQQEDRLFKLSLRGLAPIQQELLEASHYSKKPVEWYVNNYEKALEGVADGSFDEDKLAGMKAYGMLVDTHEKELARKLRERDSSPRALQIQLNCAAQFREKMKKLKIEDETYALQDRFNYDYEQERKKNGGFVSNKRANEMMDDILAPEVIGQTRTWLGGVRDVAVRRGEIAPGAERGADGKWYVTDADGKKHELIFPNAPKMLPPSEAKKYEGMPRPMR
ncbi:hypothetical protein [Synergistes jonesii]|uniref:Uncharacterized protein n=3 Tax=Synergistes jonesii TaxID=2754 RepID=A0A073ISF5_9BACT|nr:hypothetical protein [Synergistes jonesii]KEJ92724.1 hypothetical protein EH55_01295 [Synergistes jonesii]OFB61282.1 hypothetical protein JS72_11145 [Synergistes jonesii]OFB63673.1 hypothetical protein JS73_04590 [Synergistes jonesii]OFB64533.1 hypothetical protein JS79_05145 [Synergistes jonesii]OFB68192.1 hypothetical protein JS78_04610 [Synergistes jonesii]